MKTIKFALASAVALSLAACAGETAEDTTADETAMAEEATAPGTIVEVAQGDEATFSTLVAAVTAAELGETLSGEGPFTVFAPTNDAFGKLPEGTVEKLTTEDTETLANILKYHVVEGNVDAATLTAAIGEAGEEGYTVTTLNGDLTATIVDDAVVLTDAQGGTATVTATDVAASNGMVHVIDTVLMP